MTISPSFTTMMAGALLSGGLALAEMGTGAGIAHATTGPFTWCPGQSMESPAGPNTYGAQYAWDTGVCHTYFKVSYGYGNVPKTFDGHTSLSGSQVWEGANPPPANPTGVNCGLFACPVPPHADPNFHG